MLASLVKQKVGSCKIVQNQGPDNTDLEGRKVLPASQKPSYFRYHNWYALPWYLQMFLSVEYRRQRSQQQKQMCLYKCEQRSEHQQLCRGAGRERLPRALAWAANPAWERWAALLNGTKAQRGALQQLPIFRYTHRNWRGTSFAFELLIRPLTQILAIRKQGVLKLMSIFFSVHALYFHEQAVLKVMIILYWPPLIQ